MLLAAMLSEASLPRAEPRWCTAWAIHTLHCGLQHGLANGLLLAPVFDTAVHLRRHASMASALGHCGLAGEAGSAITRPCTRCSACGPRPRATLADERLLAEFARDCYSTRTVSNRWAVLRTTCCALSRILRLTRGISPSFGDGFQDFSSRAASRRSHATSASGTSGDESREDSGQQYARGEPPSGVEWRFRR